MFETILCQPRRFDVERSYEAPILVSDELLDYWGQRYVQLQEFYRDAVSFERYLVYQVRNQALFEKLRHHRSRRHGRSAFRPRAGEAL